MIPAKFDYVKPSSVEEAVQALQQGGDDAKIIAGGQSLLPVLRLRLAAPSLLVDLGGIAELRGIRDEGDRVVVGAMTTYYDIIRDEAVQQHVALLGQATETVADSQVRHRGTLGGSLAHADPAGDLPAVAVALDMRMVARSRDGERVIPASEFFVDYLETALAPGEILVGVQVPKLGPGWGFHYEKFHRTAQAWAIVGVAAAVRRSNGTVEEARIGLTNMATRPVRAAAVEEAVRGAAVTDTSALRSAAAHAAENTDPPSDLHGGPDYRRHLAQVLTHRALMAAVAA